MAMNAPQGRGGYQGSNYDASGIIGPPDPLENSQAAVARAMSMIGLNPGNISPLSAAIRKKAAALVNQLVVNAANSGGEAVEALAQPAQALGMLADLLRQGVSGGKIFGGASGDVMGKLAALGEAGGAGDPNASAGSKLIASLLSNPENAEALFLQGKYGGLSSRAQAAVAQSLQGIMDQYSRQIEGSPASASSASGLLRLLLGQPMGSGFGAPTDVSGAPGVGGMGAAPGMPTTATPASPSMLQNPAAGQLGNPAGAMGGYGAGMMQALMQGIRGGAPGYQTGNMPLGTPFGPNTPPIDPSQYPPGTAFYQNR